MPFEIPESWEWVRLVDVCEYIQRGKSPKYSPIKKYPVVAQKCNQWRGFSIEKAQFIEPDSLASYGPERILQDNDLMWNSTGLGTLGRMTIYKVEANPYGLAVADSHVTVIRPFKQFVLPEYLYFYFANPTVQKVIEDQADGTTKQKELATATIKAYLTPIPPLEEQHRILAKLSEVLPIVQNYGEIYDESVAMQDAFTNRLKKSILHQAVQGKLVPQDPADEPAEILLERIRSEKQRLVKEGKIKKDKHESIIFRRDNSHYEIVDGVERCIDEELPFEIPKNWCWCRWGALSESIQYGYNAPAQTQGRIRMVRISDIQDNTVLWDSVPFCNIDEEEIDTYKLESGDILFARTGGTVGKSYLVQVVPVEAVYAGYLIRTRYSKVLSPEYLKFFMESELYWNQLRAGTIATAQPNCNGKTLSKMLLPVPPASEQFRIAQKIQELFSICEQL